MKRIKIINQTKKKILASKGVIADNWWSRTVGLLANSSLKQGEGLVIRPCSAIHSFGMRFAIDVLFLDKEGKVLKIKPNFLPFRLAIGRNNVYQVIELPVGKIEESSTKLGDLITLEEDDSETNTNGSF